MENINYKNLFFLVILMGFISCNNMFKKEKSTSQKNEISHTEEELYRPNFHFTPEDNWMNDPNGMFYFNGNYHLYFQHYPESNVWGPMHWGHAISKDLVTWEEQKIALYPDEKGYIFSGSAVVDNHNTSGFKQDSITPIVAIFTYHDPKLEKAGEINYQSQGIAYSLDGGMTWTKYAENPVIKNPGIKDFRDPKVTWDEVHKQWVLILAAKDKSKLYGSTNLKNWRYLSDFGENIGAHGGVWECPDFFPIKVEGINETKWVLVQSLVAGGPNGGTGTQYFIGDFDGKTFALDANFSNDLNSEDVFWIDYGRDNYAGVTWSNIPEEDGRKLFLGWMSNWEYAEKVPTYKWRSSMTIPREIKLFKEDNHYKIKTQPVEELNNYFSKTIEKNNFIVDKEMILAGKSEFDFSNLNISLELGSMKNDIYTFSFSNSLGDSLKFGINNKEKFLFIDRTSSGLISFSNKFAPKQSIAPFKEAKENISVRILLDKTSIELFYNNGETIMTEIFFPQQPLESFSVQTEKFSVEIENMKISQLNFDQ